MNVLILDGYNLIYRAKYSFLSKKRDKNDLEDRSIVYSFTRAVRSQIDLHKPDCVYFVLEGKPTKRLNLSEDYKANRVYEPDPGFSLQRRLIIDLVRRWPGFSVIKHPEHECDDVANTLARQHEEKNDTVVIVSSDTDFCQSLSESISVYNPVKKRFVTSPVSPADYVSWKSLRGDSSDNITGFAGIGNVRAKKLIADSRLLEEFLSKGNNREKFEHNTKMIAFEDVDLFSCQTVSTLCDASTLGRFRGVLHDLGFFSITSDKAWRKFSEPISNVKCQNVF
jgi:DNA polymerase-1